MNKEEEKYLWTVAKASDDVRYHHTLLQRAVQRGTRSELLDAGKKLTESTAKLLSLISEEGRWPESYP